MFFLVDIFTQSGFRSREVDDQKGDLAELPALMYHHLRDQTPKDAESHSSWV